MWVASVANIDWPSAPGLPVERQQAEMAAILDRAQTLKLNTVILQVRPAGDALYASPLEPWSEYLTGEQGRAPVPAYDPLELWVREAHRRGLELHAWFNPYRARHQEAKSPFAPQHIARAQPASVRQYGDLWWMDPSDPVAVRRTLAVITDVVRRYDVDGVHIDDYFYPYPIPAPGTPPGTKQSLDFPDEASWAAYRQAGGKLSRADWRRDNVDRLVETLNQKVHAVKPWVKFGVSPFGLGRPDRRPRGITGFSQYDSLYADAELWLAKGWLDYFVPQLYWRRSDRAHSFPVLLDYWVGQNRRKRQIWAGLFTSRINPAATSWSAAEITGQIAVTRTRAGAAGHAHFSMKALLENRRGIADELGALYATPALPPACAWLDRRRPAPPQLKAGEGAALTVRSAPGTVQLAVWRRFDAGWRFAALPAAETALRLQSDPQLGRVLEVAVSAVSRTGVESRRVRWSVPQAAAAR